MSQAARGQAHEHVFLGEGHARNERRTWIVIALTAAMMVGEVLAGWAYGSIALLADGFHMATHAGALLIAALAYRYARRHAQDPRFTFGTGKVGELAGYSSAMILGIIALLIGWESLQRLIQPVSIHFEEAIAVAALGLFVNLASAYLLHANTGHDSHHHAHDHHHHHHGHGDGDTNLRSAYAHVLADAFTSALAIIGLIAGRALGWHFLDPLIGVVGAIVIAHWSIALLRASAATLLDAGSHGSEVDAIRSTIESDGACVADLHVWAVGPGHVAAIVSLVDDRPRPPDHYKRLLADRLAISHLTIEVNAAPA